jgi:hypothetical protein
MRPVEIGQFHDKFLRCDNCGYQIDVADQIEMEESEESRTSTGTYRSVKKVIRRSDPGAMQGGDPQQMITVGSDGVNPEVVDLTPEQANAAVEQVRALMGDAMAEQVAAELAGLQGTPRKPGSQMVMTSVETSQKGFSFGGGQGLSPVTIGSQPGGRRGSVAMIVIGVLLALTVCMIIGGAIGAYYWWTIP